MSDRVHPQGLQGVHVEEFPVVYVIIDNLSTPGPVETKHESRPTKLTWRKASGGSLGNIAFSIILSFCSWSVLQVLHDDGADDDVQ